MTVTTFSFTTGATVSSWTVPNHTGLVTITAIGDGTGVRTTYDADGTINTVEQLTGLPIPPPDQVTADVDAAAALAAMSTALAPLTGTSTSAQQRAALLALRAAISDALSE